jgi:hypothetical protein
VTGRIDAFARQPHYVDHLAPVWRALPHEHRGHFYVGASSRATIARAQFYGFSAVADHPPRNQQLIMIAGGLDLRVSKRRPTVLIEHGAGQTYEGDPLKRVPHVSYAGGEGRDSVRLFVCPRQEVADRNLARYPEAETVVASPRLEYLQTMPRVPDRDNVVVSRHWDIAHVPEMTSAWPHWREAVAHLAESGRWSVALHAHPRAARQMVGDARLLGAHFLPAWEDVIAQAAVYVCDNSSTLFEAAWLGIPVVVLDAPWYRRNIEHGLRFWSHADIGPRPASPEALEDAVIDAAERDGL